MAAWATMATLSFTPRAMEKNVSSSDMFFPKSTTKCCFEDRYVVCFIAVVVSPVVQMHDVRDIRSNRQIEVSSSSKKSRKFYDDKLEIKVSFFGTPAIVC